MKGRIVKLFLAALLGLLGPVVNAAGTVTYVYTDPQGTPLAEANASGTITATFDYKPYGAQAMGTPTPGPGYTGHVNDPDTGFVYMQARYYDPGVGRFLSVDPLRGRDGGVNGINAYSYVSNNPISRTDPTGMYSCEGTAKNCSRIDRFIGVLHKSLKNLKSGTDEYNKLARVIAYYGDKNSNKNIIIKVVNSVRSGELSNANSISMPSLLQQAAVFGRYAYNKGMKSDDVLNATGAAILAHEGRHRLDAESFDVTAGRTEYKRSELNAERTESAAYHATGLATGLWWPGASSGQIDANIQVQAAADTAVWCEEATSCN